MISKSAGTSRYAFLITAAGSGTRMGAGIKKEFRELNGMPVLALTLKNFLDTSLFQFGIITCKAGTREQVRETISACDTELQRQGIHLLLCDGGKERQQSVLYGLQSLADKHPELCDDGYVLIHDGARPWAGPELIGSVAEGCRRHNACAPIIPSVDAMKEVNENGIITGHLPRKETVGVQTPQGFMFREILHAHNRAAADGRHYIDDTEIFSRYEGDVYTVSGTEENRKITYAGDIQ